MKKVRLLLASFSLATFAFCGFLAVKDPIVVGAEGSEASSQVAESSSEAAPQEQAQEATTQPVKYDWIQDRLIPIVGGFSVAQAVTIAISIATALYKHKKDKKDDKKIKALEELVISMKEGNDIFSSYSKGFLEDFQKTLVQTKESMDHVAEYAKGISERIDQQNEGIGHVEKMRDSIDASCKLIAKTLALSDVAVKSGIAEDAQKIVENIQGGNSDGEEN